MKPTPLTPNATPREMVAHAAQFLRFVFGSGPGCTYEIRGLPPEERQQVLQGLRRWRQLPPAERQHMLENYHRWQQMTPAQRKAARIRWRQFHLKHVPLTKIP